MRLTAALITLCISITEIAAAQPPNVLIMGSGAKSCAKFAEDYRRSPDAAMAISFAWAQGFMSGLNIDHDSKNEPTRDLSSHISDQEDSLRLFCDQRPLLPFAAAVEVLYLGLPQSPPQSN